MARPKICSRVGVRPWCVLACILLAARIDKTFALMEQGEHLSLRTLTTAREAHSMSMEDAKRAYPVHLRGVVTYYDALIDPRRPALFIHDSTGGIFVALSPVPTIQLHPGTLVEVIGVSAGGDYAPIVGRARVKVIGEAALPKDAPRVSMGQLLTGEHDGQWVEVEGVVRSFSEYNGDITLKIAMSDGPLTVTTLNVPGTDYSRLVDAKIKLRGTAAPLFNRNLQMTGVHVFFPGIELVTIEEPAIADVFALPVVPIGSLLRYAPGIAFSHRVHVRGPVTLQWPGRSLCIQNGTEGLCVPTLQKEPLAEGEMVDVAGFLEGGGFTPTLADAIYRAAGGSQAINAPSIIAAQAFRGDFDAELVEIEGKLIGKDLGAKDPTLVLSSGKFLFPVVLGSASSLPDLEEGSALRVIGVCSVQVDTDKDVREGFSVPASFRILLRSRRDIVVVQKASWWTAAHLLPVLALVLAAALCALGWVAALRHRVTAQTVLIRKQNVTLRNLSFQDGLTGVANRRRFDDTLQLEFSRAIESSAQLSLLMIDIDHFKVLNDTYGHQRGDDCLVRVAKALSSASLRTSDLLARYGGEEFAVIMPACDESGAFAAGERMRAAVRGLSITHAGSPFDGCVSVSVGVATMQPGAGSTPASLIALADRALYQSKAEGRNRTTYARRDLEDYTLANSAG